MAVIVVAKTMTSLKRVDLDVCKHKPKHSVDNEYNTGDRSIRQPALHMVVGQRTSGKSYLASQMLHQAMKEHTFDVVYMVTPSFDSNREYFQKFVTPSNVFDPTKKAIDEVIGRVEQDRDDWVEFLDRKRRHKDGPVVAPASPLLNLFGMSAAPPPKWKYQREQPPRSLVILDDVIGSPAIAQSSGLNRIATLNRHIAPLPDVFVDSDGSRRSACGLGVWILSQTYRMQGGIGRVLRENCSALTLFKNRQAKQREAILQELGSVISEDLIEDAWDQCCTDDKPHGNLTIDFRPKCKSLTLREGMRTALIYDHPDTTCSDASCKIKLHH